MGTILGARVLGEFGDDRTRITSPQSRKNYAGTSPITRASGRSHIVLARHVRNRRPADALDWQAFCSLTTSPGARAYYDQLRRRQPQAPGGQAGRKTAQLAGEELECTRAGESRLRGWSGAASRTGIQR